jgi:hypothetical protein
MGSPDTPTDTWSELYDYENPKFFNQAQHDAVNSPKHYTSHPSGVECIEITQHYNFCVGNAIKYLWRNGLKNETNAPAKTKQIEDLEKAVWYITREIKNLKSGVYE